MKSFARGSGNLRRALIAGLALFAMALMPMAALGQVAPATNNSADAIGPEQLRNFSLGVKPAVQAPAQDVPPDLITPRKVPGRPVRSEPRVTREPVPAPSGTLSRIVPPPTISTAPIATPVVQAPIASTAPTRANTPAASEVTVALPPANPLSSQPTPANEADIPRISSQPMGAGAPLQQSGNEDGDSTLAWIIVLLLAGGAAVAFLFRSRWREEPALAAGPISLPREMEPRSFPPVPPPPPIPELAPQSAPLVRAPVIGGITIKRPDAFALKGAASQYPIGAGGIVSTRLRPWLEIEFDPTRAVIDEARASVEFDVIVTNSGNAPARNVLVEACMINAGTEQEAELRRFFEKPIGAGDRMAAIAPLAKIALKSIVSLPLDQVRAYEVNGRRLFVPLVAFNALYEWGSSAGQTSASFILGRATSSSEGEGEGDSRMAPLRLDLGPRNFRGLEGRRHPLGMRR
jgi:hypothetical protein